MNSEGVLVFDVNDFDEAYLGNFTWDLRRFVASLALMGWQKALPEDAIRDARRTYLRVYVEQIGALRRRAATTSRMRCASTTPTAPSAGAPNSPAERAGSAMLDAMTEMVDEERQFVRDGQTRELSATESGKVLGAYKRYLKTIPDSKRERHLVFYDVKDVVGRQGFGIGSAGPPGIQHTHRGIQPGPRERHRADDEAGQCCCPSRVVDAERAHAATSSTRVIGRSSASARSRSTPTRSSATPRSDRIGFVVAELSPYEADLDWAEITEPDEIGPVLEPSGGRRRRSTVSLTRTRRGPGRVPDRGGDRGGDRR